MNNCDLETWRMVPSWKVVCKSIESFTPSFVRLQQHQEKTEDTEIENCEKMNQNKDIKTNDWTEGGCRERESNRKRFCNKIFHHNKNFKTKKTDKNGTHFENFGSWKKWRVAICKSDKFGKFAAVLKSFLSKIWIFCILVFLTVHRWILSKTVNYSFGVRKK